MADVTITLRPDNIYEVKANGRINAFSGPDAEIRATLDAIAIKLDIPFLLKGY